MSKRSELLESISETIADYREGEIRRPTPEHVDRWINQFDDEVQKPMLAELDHVLKYTYFSRQNVKDFLAAQVKNEKLGGDDSCSFWRDVEFLRIQGGGNSQREMLAMFDGILEEECGVKTADCGETPIAYLYLDDAIFTGSRVGGDLSDWIRNAAPIISKVHILVIATYTLGEWQAMDRLKKEAVSAGKAIDFHCWRAASFENRKSCRNTSEVLWPATLPDDEAMKAYIKEEKKFPFEHRQSGGKLKHEIFSSEEGRQLFERELLLAGIRIRGLCENPRRAMRPLGFSAFGLGFGSTIVTFRNCPNNCPLALWWGDPDAPASSPLSKWYPLFPRKTYGQDIDFG